MCVIQWYAMDKYPMSKYFRYLPGRNLEVFLSTQNLDKYFFYVATVLLFIIIFVTLPEEYYDSIFSKASIKIVKKFYIFLYLRYDE
jgi:hypothetical protein